ncbi:MAG: ABC transporter transmembrane domain-containing protein, partial [Thermodesulfobacteriota bacterium]|nr:ABC transporter transmembrane domain-containing protein [Thermodesulfobacteriota bacterium]
MNIYRRLLSLAKPHITKFLCAMACMLAVGATTSALAFLVKPALDEIFLKQNADMLKLIPIVVIIIYIIKGGCSYGQTMFMSFIGQRVVTDLRSQLYNHIQKQPLAFFTNNPTGILMS